MENLSQSGKCLVLVRLRIATIELHDSLVFTAAERAEERDG
jgi:hypothetical protein